MPICEIFSFVSQFSDSPTFLLFWVKQHWFLQGVPIHMEIEWRLLYRICSMLDYLGNLLLQYHI